MSDTITLISALETAPGVIIPLIREVPPEILKRRPSPGTWSAYENAIHLSQTDASFRARLDLILSTPEPFIKTIENSADDEAGAMLDVDLDESLERFARERATLVEDLSGYPSKSGRKQPCTRRSIITQYSSCSGICTSTKCSTPPALNN